MSLWTRIANVFRGDRLSRDIEEELRSHLDEAQANGIDPDQARRAFGSPLIALEASRDIRLIPWLDSLRADAVFGWRLLIKRKIVSASAVLSLALAIGASISAFRLIDALLLRPLPVAHPERLVALYKQGTDSTGTVRLLDIWAYPSFQLMRAAVKDQAELIAVSLAFPTDLTWPGDDEMEKGYVQYVSGWMFDTFGLHPALGRLLHADDDSVPGAHAYAVISYDYWVRRFARDPHIAGRTFRLGDRIFEITGVAPQGFTGTETGTFTDLFVPIMTSALALRDDNTWHRILASVNPGVNREVLRAQLDASARAFEENRAKSFKGMSRETIDKILSLKLVMLPAAAGASGLQQDYRTALIALGALVTLVLLIACANVANLMTAQAAGRAREMALRVSIGAGKGRLIQLVLMESAWLAFLAASLGACFAWWAAPFVVGMINPPDHPARLVLPADGKVLMFSLLLTVAVLFLFGLAPALRASSVRPASALKGGDNPHARPRLMHALIAVQVAFCFLVLFVTGLFATSFERLAQRPMGFSAEHIIALDTVAQRPVDPVFWEQTAARLRSLPDVESVAIAGWPLLGGYSWNGFISVQGAPPGPDLGYFLNVSPGWLDTMKVRLIVGRDLRPGETFPGAALVNEAFAKTFFRDVNPIGKTFAKGGTNVTVVGIVADAPYRSVREEILPVACVPLRNIDAQGAVLPLRNASFLVRTRVGNPASLGPLLRREVSKARSDFRVSTVRTQSELIAAQTVRERLLATLAYFFAAVALVLAGIGLFGVLDYSVLQRRREIGIRMAIGARPSDIAARVTAQVFAMVFIGAAAGLALGLCSGRVLEALLYQVKPAAPGMLALPALAIAAIALLAALPAVLRAVRIDPVAMLRSE